MYAHAYHQMLFIMAKQNISHECALLILEKKRFGFSLITHLYDL